MHLVDTNVLSDVATRNARWFEWSSRQLERHTATGLAINQIILAEISALYDSPERVEAVFSTAEYTRLDLPWEAAFATSRAFLLYKRSGGPRDVPMPDFYIGAHALVACLPLITRDAARYRTYFPEVVLVAPD